MCVAIVLVLVQGDAWEKGGQHAQQVFQAPLRLQMLIHDMVNFDAELEEKLEVGFCT